MRLVLLLATQRSGSTLLEYSLSNLGGLGQVREHFAPFVYRSRRHPATVALNRWLPPAWLPERLRDPSLRQERPGRLSPHVFSRLLLAGRDDSGAAGVTLMGDYLSLVARAYFGAAPGGPRFQPGLCHRFIQSLSDQFDEVHLLRNRRGNALDQAVSRYLAGKTGQGHLIGGEEIRSRWVSGVSPEEAVARFRVGDLVAILRQLDAEERFLTRLVDLIEPPVLEIRYEQVVAKPVKVAEEVLAFTGQEGDPQRFKSPTRKVGQDAWTRAIKAKAAEALLPGESAAEDRQLTKALREAARR